MKKQSTQVKHLFLSDLQIPDHDELSLEAIQHFIKDFKPDVLHLVGDILNLTKVSKYDQDAFYHVNLKDEVEIGRKVLKKLVLNVRTANPKVKIFFYEGNHEFRLLKYLSSNAAQLAELSDEEGYLVTLPRLLEFKKLDITWIPYYAHHVEKGNVVVEHGDVARAKAGYTAHAMLEKRGSSGISGHTHRLAAIFRTQGDTERFWIENGCLCKREMESPYVKKPDWIQGFSVGIYTDGIMHPCVIPIFKHSFVYGGKVYRGKS